MQPLLLALYGITSVMEADFQAHPDPKSAK